jgi:hypothetical protein
MPRSDFDEINDSTGFANGDRFESEKQVREYFTVANMRGMFGPGQSQEDQATLDRYADVVIEQKWHCIF